MLKNYYSRLVLACYAAISGIILIVLLQTLSIIRDNKVKERVDRYNAALSELEQEYESIWDRYFLTFIPVYNEKNQQQFLEFCEGEQNGYREGLSMNNMRKICSEICQQDDRIVGIYFRRFDDDSRFLYVQEDMSLKKTDIVMDGFVNIPSLPALVGGQRIEYGFQDGKSITAFGLQSRILYANEEAKSAKYRITILYDIEYMDQIVARYGLDAKERFVILAQDGTLLYDSASEYEKEQTVHCEYAEKIISGETSFFASSQSYLAKSKTLFHGNSVIAYTIPDSMINRFEVDGMCIGVIVVAGIVDVMFLLILFAIKRIFDRKFAELEKSINQIGKNNLTYRIPIEKHADEFSRIAVHFNEMCDDLQHMVEKNYIYQLLQQKAVYRAMKKYISPHFLYNSLEVVRGMLRKGGHVEEDEVILLLSRILDYQIHGDYIVKVWMEIEALQNYMDFLAIRSNDSFDYDINVDKGILDYNMPKLILQPMVEYCFEKILRKENPGTIYICGILEEEMILIEIQYQGQYADIGLKKNIEQMLEKTEESDDIISLNDIVNRIYVLYGGKSKVTVDFREQSAELTIRIQFAKMMEISEQKEVEWDEDESIYH